MLFTPNPVARANHLKAKLKLRTVASTLHAWRVAVPDDSLAVPLSIALHDGLQGAKQLLEGFCLHGQELALRLRTNGRLPNIPPQQCQFAKVVTCLVLHYLLLAAIIALLGGNQVARLYNEELVTSITLSNHNSTCWDCFLAQGICQLHSLILAQRRQNRHRLQELFVLVALLHRAISHNVIERLPIKLEDGGGFGSLNGCGSGCIVQ
mmetsp:Transcript_75018/g.139978  ORF Transcript_75018/g.139978 Transcript_75018/m.139978 type:complete len:208 (-) Transcript_75018:795-1418(-)